MTMMMISVIGYLMYQELQFSNLSSLLFYLYTGRNLSTTNARNLLFFSTTTKMKWLRFLLFAEFLSTFLLVVAGSFYRCNLPSNDDGRKLVIATCDTRSGYKEFHAMKVWNVTGSLLRRDGLLMTNVCKGENWGMLGFLTKPLLYARFLEKYLTRPNAKKIHAILMDSDTFWSVASVGRIWANYDCARDGKDLVISTEMSCWVGRYCNQTDIDRCYSDTTKMVSYSPFANSGVVMGRVDEVVKMLDYVVAHNRSYYTTYGRKHKFDDQYAIADYAIKVAPEVSALDYHQLISASCSIHAPGDPPDEGWPFLCKNRNGTLSHSCHIYNNLLKRQGHFAVDASSCQAYRKIFEGMALQAELGTLSSHPLIWHGNGIMICSMHSHATINESYCRCGQEDLCRSRLSILQMLP